MATKMNPFDLNINLGDALATLNEATVVTPWVNKNGLRYQWTIRSESHAPFADAVKAAGIKRLDSSSHVSGKTFAKSLGDIAPRPGMRQVKRLTKAQQEHAGKEFQEAQEAVSDWVIKLQWKVFDGGKFYLLEDLQKLATLVAEHLVVSMTLIDDKDEPVGDSATAEQILGLLTATEKLPKHIRQGDVIYEIPLAGVPIGAAFTHELLFAAANELAFVQGVEDVAKNSEG